MEDALGKYIQTGLSIRQVRSIMLYMTQRRTRKIEFIITGSIPSALYAVERVAGTEGFEPLDPDKKWREYLEYFHFSPYQKKLEYIL